MTVSSLVFALILQGQQTQRVPSLTGNIERIEGFESKILNNRRNIIVYLPPTYAGDTVTKYPVVYMQDGQNVFDGATSYIPNQEWRADETAEALINAGIIEPLIIVAIENGGAERGNEYLPTKFKLRDSEVGGKADLYGRMMTDEIMPLVNEKYRTKTGPENTGLIGSSFGGVLSSYLGITKSNIFGRIGALSASVWVDDRILLKLVKPMERKVRRPRIWIDIGGKEGEENVRNTRDLFDTYVKNGWKANSDVVVMVEPNAEHNELSWSRRLPLVLTYLFPKK